MLLVVGAVIAASLIIIAVLLRSIGHDVYKIWLASGEVRSDEKAVIWLESISNTLDAIESRHSGDELLNELKAIRGALHRLEHQIEEASERAQRSTDEAR